MRSRKPSLGRSRARICLEAEERVGRFAESGRWADGGAAIFRALWAGAADPAKRARAWRADWWRSGHWLNLIEIGTPRGWRVEALLTAERLRPLYVASDDRPVLRQEFYETLARVLGTAEPRFEEGAAGSGRDATNKRVSNRRIKAELGVTLLYPEWLGAERRRLAAGLLNQNEAAST